ncbi:hypothetical protein M5X00_13045 [Paenibacillus alvei]|uniref:hypothetical protein n=1 Tax=Paenibacillus alvei TaxID=44250 RepID=UPI000288D2D5|nr:hypothetical protein [Paenibacillus alvei]EJW13823.1 hypothetical protein PAV_109p00530 [Paenibacillus alvei DSM 29]MCY9540548.1 hypothetical protein [Paenibacillus alvei]MCY9708247.1 hypothetical protein [Paenibacillus alvei]MCY9732956.1 hypothetical protein [Paenibacillus alvei]MCY9755167.1 hypothetical protein [Paenibacillus alvei]
MESVFWLVLLIQIIFLVKSFVGFWLHKNPMKKSESQKAFLATLCAVGATGVVALIYFLNRAFFEKAYNEVRTQINTLDISIDPETLFMYALIIFGAFIFGSLLARRR